MLLFRALTNEDVQRGYILSKIKDYARINPYCYLRIEEDYKQENINFFIDICTHIRNNNCNGQFISTSKCLQKLLLWLEKKEHKISQPEGIGIIRINQPLNTIYSSGGFDNLPCVDNCVHPEILFFNPKEFDKDYINYDAICRSCSEYENNKHYRNKKNLFTFSDPEDYTCALIDITDENMVSELKKAFQNQTDKKYINDLTLNFSHVVAEVVVYTTENIDIDIYSNLEMKIIFALFIKIYIKQYTEIEVRQYIYSIVDKAKEIFSHDKEDIFNLVAYMTTHTDQYKPKTILQGTW